MNIKELANEIYQRLLPHANRDAGEAVTIPNNTFDKLIIKKIKPLILEDYKEFVADTKDRDLQGSLKIKLRRILKENPTLQQTIFVFLKEAKQHKISEVTQMSNNKNAFKDNNIEVGRDLNIGDKTEHNTIDKQTNIDNIEGNENVHIGDIINIYEITKKGDDKNKGVGEITEKANELIAKNKIKQALELLLIHSKNIDEDIYTHILQQSQRWNKLKKEENFGTIGENKGRIISNRITYGLLEIIKELKELDH